MNRKIIYLFICLLILFSCTEKMDIPLDSTDIHLVVFGGITSDTTIHKIELYQTADFYSGIAPPSVSNAKVSISDGTNSIVLQENNSRSGVYETLPNVYGVAGNTYTLTISDVDINNDGQLETYTAESYLPRINAIDSIKIDPNIMRGNSNFIKVYSQDDGNTHDFFMFKVLVNNDLLTDTIDETTLIEDKLINGNYFEGIPVYLLNNEKPDERIGGDTISIVSGDTLIINFDTIIVSQGDTIILKSGNYIKNVNSNHIVFISDKTIKYDSNYEISYVADNILLVNNSPIVILNQDTITLEMAGITKGYYNYLNELITTSYGSNPIFSGPPANPKTNLSSGAIGFFAAYSVVRTTTIYPSFK